MTDEERREIERLARAYAEAHERNRWIGMISMRMGGTEEDREHNIQQVVAAQMASAEVREAANRLEDAKNRLGRSSPDLRELR